VQANGLTGSIAITSSPAAIFCAPQMGDIYLADCLMDVFASAGSWLGPWNSGTAYTIGQTVSYSGANYIATNASTNVTPGTSVASWAAINNSGASPVARPEDVAFYYVLGQAALGGGSTHEALRLLNHTYTSCLGWNEGSAAYLVDILGAAVDSSSLYVDCGVSDVISHFDALTATGQAPRWTVNNLKINGNAEANHCFTGNALNVAYIDNIICQNAIGHDYWVELGDPNPPGGYIGNNYTLYSSRLLAATGGNPISSWASLTAPSGGNGTWTVNSPGSYQNNAPPGFIWPVGYKECSTVGTVTVTMAGTGPYTVSSVTSSGFTCPAVTLEAVVPDIYNTTFGIELNSTDSTFTDLTCEGLGNSACIMNYGSDVHFLHAHPTTAPILVQDAGTVNVWDDLYLDSAFHLGLDIYTYGNVFNSVGSTWNAQYPGSLEIYFESQLYNNIAPTVIGTHACVGTIPTGYVLFANSSGPIPDAGTGPYFPSSLVLGNGVTDCSTQNNVSRTSGLLVNGQITMVSLPNAPTPTVTPNTTGSTTVTYGLGAFFRDGSRSNASSATIANSAATPNNTITWSLSNMNNVAYWEVECITGCPTTGVLTGPLQPQTSSYTDTTGVGSGSNFTTSAGQGIIFSSGTQLLNTSFTEIGPVNPKPTATTLTGTSGSATCSQSVQGNLKIATCYLNGYAETGSAQTFAFPTAFSTYPYLGIGGATQGTCGTYNATTSASTLTLPANASMTAETCTITAIGQ
jgi:hypothetical protein